MLRISAQNLFTEVQPHLNFASGDVIMLVMDSPDMPPQYTPVIIAQSAQAQEQPRLGTEQVDRVIGVCQLIQNPPIPVETAVNTFGPLGAAQVYFQSTEDRQIELAGVVRVVSDPTHGSLKDIGNGAYRYIPDVGYTGQDEATFLVEIGGYKVKAMYFFKVEPSAWGGTEDYDPYWDKKNCPQGPVWKISLNPDDPNAPVYTFQHPYELINPLAYTIQANLTIADLPFGALGQTTGTTITLDDNAAGHGWFIDSTPWSNDEYLPTHDPNVWVAKDGSAAAGKMDMLSVLLHEYGHALGIDHSADHSSYMATTLTPGTRRMPSPEELAHLAELVGDMKQELVASTATSSACRSD